jgi:rare lipoprotein A
MSLIGSSSGRICAPLSRYFIPISVQHIAGRLAVFVSLAVLAACAQSPTVTSKSELHSMGRQASRERPIVGNNHVALGATSYGFASYYEEGTQTASGENFDPQALTAAHPDLPFGTKLRVTNVTTGKSVIVRVNDRGPFVPGRIVDVSHSAAAALGMIEQGTAKVKVDVVQ